MESHTFEMVDAADNTAETASATDSLASDAGMSRDLAIVPGELLPGSSRVGRMQTRSQGGLTRVADAAVILWRQPVVRAAVRAGTSALMLSLAVRGARAIVRERLPVLTRKRAPGTVTYAVMREIYVFHQGDSAY